MADSVLTAPASKAGYSAKDLVRDLVDELPDNCTLEDIMLELYIRASVIESRQQMADGQGLSLEQAQKELDSWFTSRSLRSSSPS